MSPGTRAAVSAWLITAPGRPHPGRSSAGTNNRPSTGAACSASKNDPDTVADLPKVEALIDRAAVLDEKFEHGAIHSFLIQYEMARPGLSPAEREKRAKEHFDRAVELGGGKSVSLSNEARSYAGGPSRRSWWSRTAMPPVSPQGIRLRTMKSRWQGTGVSAPRTWPPT